MTAVWMHRVAGIIGIAGALLFLAGDMLFNGHFGPGDHYAAGVLAVVQNASAARIFAGGAVGPLAAFFCMVGFWHVYQTVRPQAQAVGRVLLAAAWLFMTASGAVHMLWADQAIGLKYCTGGAAPCPDLLRDLKSYGALAWNLASVPGYATAGLLVYLVLFGKTWCPRWSAVTNPAIWLWLFPLLPTAPAPFGAIIVGASYNLSWAVFFLVSLVTTWSLPVEQGLASVQRIRFPMTRAV